MHTAQEGAPRAVRLSTNAHRTYNESIFISISIDVTINIDRARPHHLMKWTPCDLVDALFFKPRANCNQDALLAQMV